MQETMLCFLKMTLATTGLFVFIAAQKGPLNDEVTSYSFGIGLRRSWILSSWKGSPFIGWSFPGAGQ
ncbi:hypothetical protein QE152_g37979 [Popillia japonica]|uniref:Uncharacterized protein n=1 Tax=Popillia japonica TaxID=7064 RepID=A0AAW1I8L5_POPJA